MSATFLKYVDSIEDPRVNRCKLHNILDIFSLAISAVISGAEGWEDIGLLVYGQISYTTSSCSGSLKLAS